MLLLNPVKNLAERLNEFGGLTGGLGCHGASICYCLLTFLLKLTQDTENHQNNVGEYLNIFVNLQ